MTSRYTEMLTPDWLIFRNNAADHVVWAQDGDAGARRGGEDEVPQGQNKGKQIDSFCPFFLYVCYFFLWGVLFSFALFLLSLFRSSEKVFYCKKKVILTILCTRMILLLFLELLIRPYSSYLEHKKWKSIFLTYWDAWLNKNIFTYIHSLFVRQFFLSDIFSISFIHRKPF